MHAARLDRSSRLQRVHELLRDGAEHSTREISREVDVYAVNSIVAELRHAGAEVECRQVRSPSGGRIWLYRMTRRAGNPPDVTDPYGLSSTSRIPEQVRIYKTPTGSAMGHVGEGHEFRQLGLFA